MSGNSEQPLRLGFLSAIGDVDNGFVAGLLVTNQFGRPLEFQCTTPVKPNHTQVLLYGPTLVPFVLGELMGRTLIEKVHLKPHLILTDCDEILELRNHISIPTACLVCEGVRPVEQVEPTSRSHSDDGVFQQTAAGGSPEESSRTVEIGGQTFRFHPGFSTDSSQLQQIAGESVVHIDLAEPLERVRVALDETRSAGAAA